MIGNIDLKSNYFAIWDFELEVYHLVHVTEPSGDNSKSLCSSPIPVHTDFPFYDPHICIACLMIYATQEARIATARRPAIRLHRS